MTMSLQKKKKSDTWFKNNATPFDNVLASLSTGLFVSIKELLVIW